jgi:NAD(P)H-quinone oxidoreductase subunit 5
MDLFSAIAAIVFFGPLSSLLILSVCGFTKVRGNERSVKRIVAFGQGIGLLAASIVVVGLFREYLKTGVVSRMEVVHYHFFSFSHHSVEMALQLDALNISFVLMAMILSNIVGVFSQHYLHRDPGFFRFFFLIVLFLNGALIVFMASSFQTLFVGWELVGITSALLISFFTVRRETIDNALHAFWAYRVSDIGILCGSLLLAAHLPNDFFFRNPGGPQPLPHELIYVVPFLFLFSAMGKSAQFPYSSWLPRAMEGPTSSSAIFYGGLSIHAGVFLLLRLRMQYEVPTAMLVATGIIGGVSCLYGVLLSQVQSDVKSALAYASLSQVGIMFVEISVGWLHIAVIHCLGHAFLRTYQILKCSSIIHQYVAFEDAHLHDASRAKAKVLHVFAGPRFFNVVFSSAFDLALRAAAGRSYMVALLERLSAQLQRCEEKWLSLVVSGAVRSSKK